MLAEPSSTIELPTLVSTTLAILALGRGSATTILLAAKVVLKCSSADAKVTGVLVTEPEFAISVVKTVLVRNAVGDTLKSMAVVAALTAALEICMPLPGVPSWSKLCNKTNILSTALLLMSEVLARSMGVMIADAVVEGSVTLPT